MSLEDWKAAWGIEHLIFANDHAGQLPESARQFLQSFGLPRYFTFDSVGVEKRAGKEVGGYAFEISFEQLSRELDPYNKNLSWGDFYDEQQDQAWSQQLVIGNTQCGGPEAHFCVHQTAATVTLIFCEDESQPEWFVNSSVPQFGKSLLLLKQWSLASRTSTVATWQEAVSKLVEDLRNVDPDALQHEKCYWPSEVRAIQNSVKPGSVEITFDPIPEFHSYQRWQSTTPARRS